MSLDCSYGLFGLADGVRPERKAGRAIRRRQRGYAGELPYRVVMKPRSFRHLDVAEPVPLLELHDSRKGHVEIEVFSVHAGHEITLECERQEASRPNVLGRVADDAAYACMDYDPAAMKRRFRRALDEKGLTPTDAAKLAKLSPNALTQFLGSDRRSMDHENIVKLVNVLKDGEKGITEAWLLGVPPPQGRGVDQNLAAAIRTFLSTAERELSSLTKGIEGGHQNLRALHELLSAVLLDEPDVIFPAQDAQPSSPSRKSKR